MPKMSLQVDLIRALDQVNLTLKKDGANLGGMGLSAADMDDLIARLSRARAAMTDIVPPLLEPGARLQATPAPAWHIKRHNDPRGTLLTLRHPGLGWLSFLLPLDSATGLARAINKGLRCDEAQAENPTTEDPAS